MEFKAVIFDFNGTLFKDGEYHVQAWQEISYRLTGQKMSRLEIEKNTHGACNDVTLERLSGGTLSAFQRQAWSKEKEALYRQKVIAADHAQLCQGAPQFFDWLIQRHIPFTIASASIEENIDFFFDFFRLDQWFERQKVIYDDGSFADKVPMFLAAASLLKQPIKETLIIEDSISGLNCAKKAGFSLIAMIANSQAQYRKYQADPNVLFCAYDFTSFLSWLKENDPKI